MVEARSWSSAGGSPGSGRVPSRDPGRGTDTGSHGRARAARILRGLVTVALVVGPAVPVLVAAATLIGRDWVPAGDEAVIVLRAGQVGGADSPLVGVYSTRGFAHPGPVLFWVLAPVVHLTGSQGTGVFVTAAVVNAALLVLVGVAARRRGGFVLLAWTSVLLALLVRGLRAELLVQIWNPYVALVPYLLFLFVCWSLLDGRRWALPIAVGLGSAIVQLHVAYIPLVGAALGLAAVWRFRATRGAALGLPRRVWLTTMGIAAALWVLPLYDLAFGDHQLARLAKHFATPSSTTVGTGWGFGLLGGHVAPTGPWSGGRERVDFGNVMGEPLWWLAALVGLLGVALVVAGRRRTPALATGPALALVQLAAGAFAATRVEAPVLSYLIVWMLPLTMFAWFVAGAAVAPLLVEVWHRLGERDDAIAPVVPEVLAPVSTGRGSRGAPMLRPGAIALGLATVGALVVLPSGPGRWDDPPLPRQEFAVAVDDLGDQVARTVGSDAPMRVEQAGDEFNEGWVGVAYRMAVDDYDFTTSDGAAGLKWGRERRGEGEPTTKVLSIVTSREGTYDWLIDACAADPAYEQVASHEGLDPAERRLYQDLMFEAYVTNGQLPDDKRFFLESLRQRALRMVIFLGPRACRL